MPRRVIISPWFDTAKTSGGAVFSVDVARVWLEDGHEVHILCSNVERRLGELKTFVESGQLVLHEVSKASEIYRSHEFSKDLFTRAERIINQIRPESVHVHNLHGLIGAAWAATESAYPSFYVALDFGLICMSWFLYDGTMVPCSGPSAIKCRACLRRNEGPSLLSRVARFFPSNIIARVRPGVEMLYFRQTAELSGYYDKTRAHLDRMLPLLGKFTKIIAPSPIMAQMLRQFGAPADRVYTLVYGVAQEKVDRWEADHAKSPIARLAFLGNRTPVKGLQVLVKALSRLPEGLDLEVVAYGDCQSFIQGLPSTSIRYLRGGGPLTGEAIGRVYSGVDAVLVPSLWHENSPLVILEALANGTPVIASTQAGISHLVRHMENGLLVPPGDVEAWADVIQRVARRPEIVRGMRLHCCYERSTRDFCVEMEDILNGEFHRESVS